MNAQKKNFDDFTSLGDFTNLGDFIKPVRAKRFISIEERLAKKKACRENRIRKIERTMQILKHNFQSEYYIPSETLNRLSNATLISIFKDLTKELNSQIKSLVSYCNNKY
jgi:hypothetical protein